MPATEEKVNTTLREVIGESVNNQTQKKSDDNKSEQTQSGRKPEFVSGVDVSDMPDNLTRSEAKGWIEKKAKLLEEGYQSKFKNVAELAKVQDELRTLGVSAQDARRIINDAVASNKTVKEAAKEVKREIEKLEEEAPDNETRQGVKRLGKVVQEEVENSPAYKKLLERLDKAEKTLGYVNQREATTRKESLNEALDKLKGEKFDDDFIEKYREKIVEEGIKFPNAPVNKILQVVTDPDDYDSALLKTKNKEVKKESRIKEKINANDSASSGVTGSEKHIDVRNTSWKSLLRQVTQKR